MALQVANFLFTSCNFLATPFEKRFHPQQTIDFAKSNYFIPITLVTIYLIGCFSGKYLMQSQKAFDLRVPLALWNAFLCFFSFIGMTRTVSSINILYII